MCHHHRHQRHIIRHQRYIYQHYSNKSGKGRSIKKHTGRV